MMPVLGIDPGVNGGIAVLNADGSIALLEALKPTMTDRKAFAAARKAREAK